MWKAITDEEHHTFNSEALNVFVEKYRNDGDSLQALYFYRENKVVKHAIFTHRERNPNGVLPSDDAMKEASNRVQQIINHESVIPHPKYIWSVVVYVFEEHLLLAPMASNQRVLQIEPLVVN